MEKALIERVLQEQLQEFKEFNVEIIRKLDLAPHFKNKKEVTAITGVRRCGKSTLLKQIHRELPQEAQVLFATFDDPRYATFEASDFEVLFELWLANADINKPHYLFFDEIQLVEGWEQWADYFSKRPHTKVFVTGSNATLLSSEFSDLLTGRHLDLHLTPFSFAEIVASAGINNDEALASPLGRAKVGSILAQFRNFGDFPRVYLNQSLVLLNQYYTDIMERDIFRRHKRANPRYLLELGTILASESSRLFNRSKTATVIGLKDPVTVGKYLNSFVSTYLYRELRQYSPSVRKQLRSLSKFYCVDHALARENGFRADYDSGGVLEHMVLMELLRAKVDIYYWHSRQNLEVDFLVVERRRPLVAIQVATSLHRPETRARELRALAAARKELKIDALFIITMDESSYLKEEGVRIIPFAQFALEGY